MPKLKLSSFAVENLWLKEISKKNSTKILINATITKCFIRFHYVMTSIYVLQSYWSIFELFYHFLDRYLTLKTPRMVKKRFIGLIRGIKILQSQERI